MRDETTKNFEGIRKQFFLYLHESLRSWHRLQKTCTWWTISKEQTSIITLRVIWNSVNTRSLIINTRGKRFSKIDAIRWSKLTLSVRWLRNIKPEYQFQFEEDCGRVSVQFLQRGTKTHKLARKKVEDTEQTRREQAVYLRMQKYASVQVYFQNLLSSLPSRRIIIKRAGCAQAEAYYSLRRWIKHGGNGSACDERFKIFNWMQARSGKLFPCGSFVDFDPRQSSKLHVRHEITGKGKWLTGIL